MLRSVADGDILMMKHHLGWLSDSDFEDDDDDDTALPPDSKLCHPLCQCSKCAMLQKVMHFSMMDTVSYDIKMKDQ